MSVFSSSQIRFLLPAPPPSQTGAVKAWSEPVQIPSYSRAAPSPYPAFPPSGAYPEPAAPWTSQQPADQNFAAIHLENEYLRLLILPDRGAYIHLALTKTTGHEMFHRESVIGPSLEGLSLTSGSGIDTPATTEIEEHPDGSRTAWCSVLDPVTGVKSMNGICLYPGRAYFEVKVRLFNRTPLPQPCRWHSQAVVKATEDARITEDVIGCYSTLRNSGFVQIADHHILAGRERKPLGSGEIELITSAFAPDSATAFSLAPYETKTFSTSWYGIREIGPPQQAVLDAAISVTLQNASVSVAIQATRFIKNARIQIVRGNELLVDWIRDLVPNEPVTEHASLPAGPSDAQLTFLVSTPNGRELVHYSLPATRTPAAPVPVFRPNAPSQIRSIENLYLAGVHLRRIANAQIAPDEYWREALRRSPSDLRSHAALGDWRLRRGEFAIAEKHFRQALDADANDGSLSYQLGLALRYLGRHEEAYDAFYRATWDYAYRAPGFVALAELNGVRNRPGLALDHLRQSLRVNTENSTARNLTVAFLRRFGATGEAARLSNENLALDPLDFWALLSSGKAHLTNRVRLDIAFDLIRAGLYEEAIAVLRDASKSAQDGSLPLIQYTLADIHGRLSRFFESHQHYKAAAAASPDNCFPSRLDELPILERAVALNPADARAPYYLGNLLYFLGRHADAIRSWEQSARLDPALSAVWRNLGLAQYNILANSERARSAYDRAWELDRASAQLLYERDQLWKLTGVSPRERLAELEANRELLHSRDDLSLELASLCNQIGQPGQALAILERLQIPSSFPSHSRWRKESVRTRLNLGRIALRAGNAAGARQQFQSALDLRDASQVDREVAFWLGEAETALGQSNSAREWWTRAAERTGDPDPKDEQAYFQALALERLDRTVESRKLLREILAWSRQLRSADAPLSDQLFRVDGERRNKVDATFLEAQARLGLGQQDRARRLLGLVLGLDRSHAGAADLLASLEPPSPRRI